jgi:outer membrane protein insertion porin family
MPRLRIAMLLLACALPPLAAAGRLRAQSSVLTAASPKLERVVISGVRGVDMAELRQGLATQPSRCRSLFIKPFCLVFKSSFFYERHTLDRKELPQDELRIRVYLWRRGWRQATVATRIEPRGAGVQVVFDVSQGDPTIVRTLTLTGADSVLGRRQIRAAALPGSGSRLNVLQLDSARVRLLAALWERGYGDAQVQDTTLPVDSLGMAVQVAVQPGRRTTVSAIDIEGNEKVSDRTVIDAMPIRVGQLYRPTRVGESQRALYLTGMFRQALVSSPAQPDSAKTIQVAVKEAPFRLLRSGVGFTTVDYVQTQAQFTQFNWLGGGRRLDVTGVVGRLGARQLNGKGFFRNAEPATLSGTPDDAFLRPTWTASAQVTQPAFPASGNSLGLGVFTHRRVEPAVVVDRGYGANATFTHDLAHRVPLSLLYRYELNTVLAGDVYFCVNYGVCDSPTIDALQGRQSLSPLSLSVLVDRVDDQLVRTSGFTARGSLEHASQLTLSDFRYNRADADFTRDLPVGKGTLAARVHGGWVKALVGTAKAVGVTATGSEEILHPSTRVYAGGARSVRGFGENQLGPRILTLDPGKLLDRPDSTTAALCTAASLVNGSCDPNGVSSADFTPRPIGGTRVAEASIEYRRPVWRGFVGAVFVDGGRVSDPALRSLAGARTAITPGFGVRYRSPIGPVRVDLGIKSARKEELTVVTQVTENGVNRLVRLDTKKHYDPLEGNHGILGQLTSRLTLHLSIGESY